MQQHSPTVRQSTFYRGATDEQGPKGRLGGKPETVDFAAGGFEAQIVPSEVVERSIALGANDDVVPVVERIGVGIESRAVKRQLEQEASGSTTVECGAFDEHVPAFVHPQAGTMEVRLDLQSGWPRDFLRLDRSIGVRVDATVDIAHLVDSYDRTGSRAEVVGSDFVDRNSPAIQGIDVVVSIAETTPQSTAKDRVIEG